MQADDQIDKYRLIRELGRGNFGIVYLAHHSLLGRDDALKVLQTDDPAKQDALLQEAKKIAKWRHPNIIQVLNCSYHQERPYLVLQYAPNGTLKDRYPLGQSFPIETILPHVQQIAEGVQYAHDRQTLHLDLKPANVLLDEQQRALVSDFGIAVTLFPLATHKTLTSYKGTPAYAAPEQCEAHPGYASDQYALATMVYQWLTGSMPFDGSLIEVVGMKIGRHAVPPLGAKVRKEIADVVLRGLAKDPRDRYPSVRAFAEALTRAARDPVARATREPPVGILLETLTGHTEWVNALAWSPDGRRLASGSGQVTFFGGRDSAIRVWDAETLQVLSIWANRNNSVWSLAWSPDGRRLASGGGQITLLGDKNCTISVWDASSRASLATLIGHADIVSSVAWSPDGRRLVSASWDSTVRVWDAEHLRPLAILSDHTGAVNQVAWSPDGRFLASASVDKTVRLWDASSNALLLSLRGHTSEVNAVVWSPDGSRLASASNENTVCLWDASSKTPLVTLAGHADAVRSVAWSPDGLRLASASNDQKVCLWDATSGALLATLEGHKKFVRVVVWSPDGRRLASGGGDKTVRIWRVGAG